MSTRSTTTIVKNANAIAYYSLMPAFTPPLPWVRMAPPPVGTFDRGPDDKYIAHSEQKWIDNQFVQEVATELRQPGQRLESAKVFAESVRRIKLAVDSVAGEPGTRDAVFLAGAEIERIENPKLRALIQAALAYTGPV
jgi:hypothetical protein